MGEMCLVATSGLRDGRGGGGVCNQMHHSVMNTVFESMFEPIFWSQWGAGLRLLSQKVHAGRVDGSSPVSESLGREWDRVSVDTRIGPE